MEVGRDVVQATVTTVCQVNNTMINTIILNIIITGARESDLVPRIW
jgi:hypothetical protein